MDGEIGEGGADVGADVSVDDDADGTNDNESGCSMVNKHGWQGGVGGGFLSKPVEAMCERI